MLVSTQSPVAKFSIRFACATFCLPLFVGTAAAQNDNPALNSSGTSSEKSILVQDDQESAFSNTANVGAVGANGTARIDTSPATIDTSSTFRARPASSVPSAPRNLVIPETPSEQTFTQLQSSVGSETIRATGDGSDTSGTFAHPNSSVRQAGDGPSPIPAKYDPGARKQSLVPITQNGLRGSSNPSGTSTSQSASFNQPPISQAGSPGGFNPKAFGGSPPNVTSRPLTNQQSFSDTQFGNSSRSNSNANQSGASRSFGQPAGQQFGTRPAANAGALSGQGLGSQPPPPLRSSQLQQKDFGRPINQPAMNGQRTGVSSQVSQAFGNASVNPNQVRPTGFTQPAQPKRKTPTALANQLMDRYQIDNISSALPGSPTKLLDMLKQPVPINRRQAMINRYWETYYDWAVMLSLSEYQNWVNSIASPTSQSDLSLLNAARSVAQDRVLAAEIQLGKSQSLLTDFMPTRTTALLPLPSDKPLIKKYKTHYERYSSHGLIPPRLRGIDTMLPKILELISQRAESVQAAKIAAINAKNSLPARQATLSAALEAGRLWRAAEADLIGTVTSYNKAIADYTMTITQGRQTPEQVVTSLIGKPKTISHQEAARQTAINQQRQFGQAGNSNPTNRLGQSQGSILNQSSILNQGGFNQRQGSRVADNRIQNGVTPASRRPALSQPPNNNGGQGFNGGAMNRSTQPAQRTANPFGDSNASGQSFQRSSPMGGQFGG